MRFGSKTLLALITGGTLLLSGCGAQPADYSQRQFKSAAELAKTVEQLAGWKCSETDRDDDSHTADSLAKYGFASVPCDNGSVTIIASDAKRAELAANPGNAIKAGYCRLDGGNWQVWGQQYIVQTAQKAMQGKLTCA
jgi:hypothetical protein